MDVITVIATLIVAGANVVLTILNRQLVQATQAQVQASEALVIGQERPLLVPVILPLDLLGGDEGRPTFNPEHLSWPMWSENEQHIILRNLGAGAAFNVASVLYGCVSYRFEEAGRLTRLDSRNAGHWTCWLGIPIAPNETKGATHSLGGSAFTQDNMHIGPHSFLAPDEEIPGVTISDATYLHRVARCSITYHDMSGRKYGSVFDFVMDTGWHMVVAGLPIERDLYDLRGSQLPIAPARNPPALPAPPQDDPTAHTGLAY